MNRVDAFNQLRAAFPDCAVERDYDDTIIIVSGSKQWSIPPRMDLNLSAEIGSARAWFLHR